MLTSFQNEERERQKACAHFFEILMQAFKYLNEATTKDQDAIY